MFAPKVIFIVAEVGYIPAASTNDLDKVHSIGFFIINTLNDVLDLRTFLAGLSQAL